jgi:hypothetical protein
MLLNPNAADARATASRMRLLSAYGRNTMVFRLHRILSKKWERKLWVRISVGRGVK